MPIKFLTFQKYAIFLFALLIFSVNSFYAQTPLKDRTAIFEEVWTTINEKYYDASFNGVNWTAVKKKYDPENFFRVNQNIAPAPAGEA